MGVYKPSEGFEKPEAPKYHWTVMIIRTPANFVHSHFAKFLVGVLVGVFLLWIGSMWFNQ